MYWCHFQCMETSDTLSNFLSSKWFCRFVLEFCDSVWIGFMHTSKTVDSWYSLFSHSSSLLLAILQSCKIFISFHFLWILHLTVILELQGRVLLLSSVHNWSFRWFIGKFSYVRSFERHMCYIFIRNIFKFQMGIINSGR